MLFWRNNVNPFEGICNAIWSTCVQNIGFDEVSIATKPRNESFYNFIMLNSAVDTQAS